ncbi:MAG: glutamate 5-kinase [Actinomycetales bacterium]
MNPPALSPDPGGELAAAERVVVKVGSSSLTSAAGGIDIDRLSALVDLLARRRAGGKEVVLVSSGAIAAGLAPLGLARRPTDLATQQAAASVGQGLLLANYTRAFAERSLRVGQVLLTADDMVRRQNYRNAQRTLYRLLQLGVVPIVNENDTVATQEIRLGDNDRLAALVAHLVHADALVLLSDVDALYDGPPSKPGSSRIERIRGDEDLQGVQIGTTGAAGVGTGGMVTKVQAARMATGSGIPTMLTSTALAEAALGGGPVGTWFDRTGRRVPTRLLWLRHAAEPRARLVLDPGAVRAITRKGASLLAAGVIRAEGSFDEGDPVDLCDESGHIVARGLVNYSSDDVPEMLGRSSAELAADLGSGYGRELVHRDVMAVLAH